MTKLKAGYSNNLRVVLLRISSAQPKIAMKEDFSYRIGWALEESAELRRDAL